MKTIGYTIIGLVMTGIFVGIFNHDFFWLAGIGTLLAIPYLYMAEEE